ncbi:MAG TPA: hypothetical protein VGX48_13590 [Pyrinomonadaceae bacterium]|nr:hypothetical protein [Pyrinomonadaceae bacterium]
MTRGISSRLLFAAACAAALVLACRPTLPGANHARSEELRRQQTAAGMKADASAQGRIRTAQLEEKAVRESSGLVASRRTPGLYWTHNDSGDGPFVFAFDAEGRRRGVWRVEGARAEDWEDIAAGPGPEQGRSYLYAADIGDNGEERSEIIVYRFAEPAINDADAASTKKEPRRTDPAEALRLTYPDGAHNAEALAVHPSSGDLYVITKELGGAGVYKLAGAGRASGAQKLTAVARLKGPGFFGTLVTGADISPDGRRVALCDYANGYELRLPDGAAFDEVWKQQPSTIPLGPRRQGEAVCYRLDGRALLATSEGSPAALFEVTL